MGILVLWVLVFMCCLIFLNLRHLGISVIDIPTRKFLSWTTQTELPAVTFQVCLRLPLSNLLPPSSCLDRSVCVCGGGCSLLPSLASLTTVMSNAIICGGIYCMLGWKGHMQILNKKGKYQLWGSRSLKQQADSLPQPKAPCADINKLNTIWL